MDQSTIPDWLTKYQEFARQAPDYANWDRQNPLESYRHSDGRVYTPMFDDYEGGRTLTGFYGYTPRAAGTDGADTRGGFHMGDQFQFYDAEGNFNGNSNLMSDNGGGAALPVMGLIAALTMGAGAGLGMGGAFSGVGEGAAAAGGSGAMGASGTGGALVGSSGGMVAPAGLGAIEGGTGLWGALTPEMAAGLTGGAVGGAGAMGAAGAGGAGAGGGGGGALVGSSAGMSAPAGLGAASTGTGIFGPGAAGLGAAGAAGAGGAAAGGGGLLGTGITAGQALGVGSTLLGAAAGAQGQEKSATETKDIPEWLKPYVGKTLDYAGGLLDKQMAPGYMAGYDDMRNVGQGLLNRPVMGNGFNRFFPGR